MKSFSIFAKKFAPLIAVASLIAASCTCWSFNGPPVTPTVPPPTTTPACTLSFISPSNGATLPETGPVNFAWTAVAQATYYILSVDLPGGGGKQNFTINGTSKTLYMDDFPEDGSFSAEVLARDSSGDNMCQAEIQFIKNPPATLVPTPKPKKNQKSIPPASPPPVIIQPLP
jgi:hypothetical protein